MKKRKKYRGEDEIMNEFKYIRGKTKNGLILVLNFILVIGIMASYRIFALDSNANLLGVNYGIVYADDFSSAQICFDLNKVDTKKFKIIDILDSNSAVLPLNKSVSTVKKNGYYIFTVRYKELDASDTQSSIKKLNMAVTVDKIKISDNKISDNAYKEENNNIMIRITFSIPSFMMPSADFP